MKFQETGWFLRLIMAMNKKNNESFSAQPAAVQLKSLSTAIGQTADHVMITDQEGIIEYVNPAFEKTTGYAAEEVLGRTPRVLKSGRHQSAFYENLWKTILAGKVFRHVIINKKKNGELYYSDQTIVPLKNARGEITRFVSVWKDMTERIRCRLEMEQLNASLRRERQKIERILEMEEKMGAFSDLNKLVDFIVNGTAGKLGAERCSLMLFDDKTGELVIKGAVGLDHKVLLENKSCLGRGVAGLVARECRPLLVKDIDADGRLKGGELPSCRTKSFMAAPIMLDQKLLGVLNVTDKKLAGPRIFTDSDLKTLMIIVRQSALAIENTQLYKELKYLTVTDPLTNLYNYRHFMRSLDYEIGRFHRFNDPLSLLIMDIDDFKEYNETHGAQAGDSALMEISVNLNQRLREVDIICRYASDEFAVILPKTDIAQASMIAREIAGSINQLSLAGKITVSFGLAGCCRGMGRHDFILKADAALTQAKRQGKNRIYCQGE